ncbi:hypothetical protein J7J84_05225 [bacterium]|nr:hypothetical protein [bacterium]
MVEKSLKEAGEHTARAAAATASLLARLRAGFANLRPRNAYEYGRVTLAKLCFEFEGDMERTIPRLLDSGTRERLRDERFRACLLGVGVVYCFALLDLSELPESHPYRSFEQGMLDAAAELGAPAYLVEGSGAVGESIRAVEGTETTLGERVCGWVEAIFDSPGGLPEGPMAQVEDPLFAIAFARSFPVTFAHSVMFTFGNLPKRAQLMRFARMPVRDAVREMKLRPPKAVRSGCLSAVLVAVGTMTLQR